VCSPAAAVMFYLRIYIYYYGNKSDTRVGSDREQSRYIFDYNIIANNYITPMFTIRTYYDFYEYPQPPNYYYDVHVTANITAYEYI